MTFTPTPARRALQSRWTRARLAACLSMLAGALVAAPASAAEIFEQGDGYTVIGYDAGLGGPEPMAMVVMRLDHRVFSYSGKQGVMATFIDVLSTVETTWEVKSAGGFDTPIELIIEQGNCSTRFKALHKAGRTVVDGGTRTCR